jgi:1-acyl-sn-glycerol-3-phosphate acyltransferase
MLTAVLGALLYLVLPRNRGKRVGRWINLGLFRVFAWMIRGAHLVYPDLEALDALRDVEGIIIAPNHLTSLDALFVISRLPNIVCIMKAGLWDNPVFGGGSRLAGYLRDDNTSSMFRKASEELQAGEQLLVFPEGTRGSDQPISPFKGGVGIIAQHSGAEVQTVLFECNTRYLGKGWPVWKLPKWPMIYRVRLGKRFSLEKNGNVKEFVAKLEEYYSRELENSEF